MFPGLSALRTQLAEFGECTSHIVLSDFPGLHMDVSELFPHLPRGGLNRKTVARHLSNDSNLDRWVDRSVDR